MNRNLIRLVSLLLIPSLLLGNGVSAYGSVGVTPIPRYSNTPIPLYAEQALSTPALFEGSQPLAERGDRIAVDHALGQSEPPADGEKNVVELEKKTRQAVQETIDRLGQTYPLAEAGLSAFAQTRQWLSVAAEAPVRAVYEALVLADLWFDVWNFASSRGTSGGHQWDHVESLGIGRGNIEFLDAVESIRQQFQSGAHLLADTVLGGFDHLPASDITTTAEAVQFWKHVVMNSGAEYPGISLRWENESEPFTDDILALVDDLPGNTPVIHAEYDPVNAHLQLVLQRSSAAKPTTGEGAAYTLPGVLIAAMGQVSGAPARVLPDASGAARFMADFQDRMTEEARRARASQADDQASTPHEIFSRWHMKTVMGIEIPEPTDPRIEAVGSDNDLLMPGVHWATSEAINALLYRQLRQPPRNASVLVLGSGRGHMLPLLELAATFSEVVLVDLDQQALAESIADLRSALQRPALGLRNEEVDEITARVKTRHQDISGVADEYFSHVETLLQGQTTASAAVSRAVEFLESVISRAPWDIPFGGSYDYIACSLLTSQLASFLTLMTTGKFMDRFSLAELGPAARPLNSKMLELAAAMLRSHARHLREWLRPGGKIYWADTMEQAVVHAGREPQISPMMSLAGFEEIFSRYFDFQWLGSWLWIQRLPTADSPGKTFHIRAAELSRRAELAAA